MKTIIDNNQRVFQIVRMGFSPRQWFCNLHDIPNVIKNELELHDEYKVFENWNFKMKSVSKKHLNEMFIANQIDFKIK